MVTIISIIFCLLVSFLIIMVIINRSQFNNEIDHDKIDTPCYKVVKNEVITVSLKKNTEVNFNNNVGFVNKDCTNLDDFIINDEINKCDLEKLAELNKIKLQIKEGWYRLVIELIKELNDKGWNRRVSCIKQRFDELKVYVDSGNDSEINEILEKYCKKAQFVCEDCGEVGESRLSEFVLCRKHYLDFRERIIVEASGFNYRNTSYLWDEIIGISFENLDGYTCLKLQLNKLIRDHGQVDNKLYIYDCVIGYGNFLNHLNDIPRLGSPYLKSYESTNYCEICGYLAVYNEKCECCENYIWSSPKNFWYDEDSEKSEYISYKQILWNLGDATYEAQQKNYRINPNYKILFTEEELKKHTTTEV